MDKRILAIVLMLSTACSAYTTPDVFVASYNGNIWRFNVSNDGEALGYSAIGAYYISIAVDPVRGIIWAGQYADIKVDKINISTMSVIDSINVGDGPNGLAVDANGNVWVAEGFTGNLTKIDGDTGYIIDHVNISDGVGPVAIDGNGVLWVGSNGADTNTYYVNVTTNALLGSVPGGNQPYGIAVDSHGIVWVSLYSDSKVQMIDAATYASIGYVDVGLLPHQVCADDQDSVWVSNSGSDTVTRINATTHVKIGNVSVESTPIGLSYDTAGFLWVTNRDSNTVSRIFVANMTVVGSSAAGSSPFSQGDGSGFSYYAIVSAGPTTTSTTTTTTTILPFSAVFTVRNFNTIQPVAGVDVQAYNESGTFSNVTDAYGNADLWISSAAEYSVSFTRSGYEAKTIRRFLNVTYQEDVFMNPQSTAGIIRIYVNDPSYQQHTNCLYFTDNGRLVTPDGCFRANDTGYQTIHTTMNYTWMTSITTVDKISTLDGLKEFLYDEIYAIIGILFMLFVFGCVLGVFFGIILFITYHFTKGGHKK